MNKPNDEFNEALPGFRTLGARINDFLASEEEASADGGAEETTPILESLDQSRYHFSEEEFLVEGGAKRIFKVYDAHAGRHVALAMPQRHGSRREREEFLREAQLTAKLQHPNILPVHEVGLNADGVPYFVTRLLEGEELKNLIRECSAGSTEYLARYDLDTLLSIFLKVCDAVVYAHSRGVLHLDLKPSNIMVGRYGLVTLFDWGLARVMGDREDLELDAGAEDFDPDLLNNITHTGVMKGTPGFMAPEQVTEQGWVSVRTDIYALGALLYFILTGTIPVRGNHAEEVIQNTLAGRVIRPRLRRPSRRIPRSLGAIAMKALCQEPADRYSSVQEMHDDITRYLRGYAPLAERAGVFKRTQLFMRRHSKVVSMLMLFGAVLTTVVSLLLARVAAQRRAAVAAKREAIHNLELYKEETRISSELYGAVKTFFINSIYQGDIWNYPLMRDMVESELAKGVTDEKYRQQLYLMKGYLHFVNQEFNAAVAALDEAGYNKRNNLYKEAVQFAAEKPEDAALLSPEQFARLLNLSYRNILFRRNIMSRCYLHYMERTGTIPPEDYLPIAIAMLNLTNDSLGWGKDVRLEPRDGGYHLDLSGAPYTTFRLPKSRWRKGGGVLMPLQLVSLDLSRSAIRDFHGLRLPESFREMDLTGVKIYDPDPITYWLSEIPMQRLIVSRGEFSNYNLARLRKNFQVLEVPPESTNP